MPCVCRKTITPTQPKPVSLNSYTLRSFVINMKKETAPGGQVPTGILVASVGSHPRAQPSSWQAEEKHISLFPSEGGGSLQAPVTSCGPRGVQGAWAACSHLLLALPRPWMHFCSWAVSSSFWRVWSAHGTLLGLSAWMCRRNSPWTFIIPGTTVNSWLGNWANLLELFISQVLFF